ncbi:MAG: hypothetical protein O2944_11635 [Proteobacteria bacterium]|nr:hypothetical protein [Pseudomonadota bacterium]
MQHVAALQMLKGLGLAGQRRLVPALFRTHRVDGVRKIGVEAGGIFDLESEDGGRKQAVDAFVGEHRIGPRICEYLLRL